MKSNFSEPGTGYVQGLTTADVKNARIHNIRTGFIFGFLTGVVVTVVVMKLKK